MNAQSSLVRFLFAPIMLWIVVLVAGTYYMVSIDYKVLNAPQQEAGILGSVKKFYSALRLNHINKGIDIAGGTYLVLGVEVDKAIENRLALENRSLDQLFSSKNLKDLPTSKVVKNGAIEIAYDDEEAAKKCASLIEENRALALRVVRSHSTIKVTLTANSISHIKTGAVDQAVNVLSNRLGSYGVEGIVVHQHGERQVVVQLPGVDDPERVKRVITKTAHLDFKIVEDRAGSREALLDKFDGELPADKMIIPGRVEEGETSRSVYLVSTFADLSGEHIVDAKVEFDQFGRAQVGFKLDSIGATKFYDLTSNNVNRNLGIVIDDVMYSSPVIKEPIPSGSCSITEIQSQKEALDLSIILKSGSLQAPLKFEQENRVGSSLGQDSINRGIFSCLIAILLLFIFSLIYYKIPGFFAVLALLYNMFLILLFLSYFGATLTLPGIAGMVVTLGMAIDASILIYENIKEELATGETLRAAINKGFGGVMAVIIDSNITTFLTGFILFQFGGPAIKGFAVTLMAGIIATLLSGVYFLKALFTLSTSTFNVKRLKF